MYSELPTLRIAPHMAILGWGFVRVIDYDDDDGGGDDYDNDLLLNTSACYSPDLTLTLADNPAEVCYNHAG